MASVSTAPYQLTMHRRTVCLRSSSRNVPSALVGRFFLGRSPPRLLNAAAPSGLKPAPASRLREACSHLQYSTRNHFRFVTHSCPQVFHRQTDSSRHEVTASAGTCTRVRRCARRAPFQHDPTVAPARARRAALPSHHGALCIAESAFTDWMKSEHWVCEFPDPN